MEKLALRHQIGVLTRALGDRHPRFGGWDRALWVVLARRWQAWRHALAIIQPATVVRWHREGFKCFWTRRTRAGCGGRPKLGREFVGLIRTMSRANVTWGALRIRNELAKLGIEIATSTVAKYMVKQRKPPSPSWRAFLDLGVQRGGRGRGRSVRASPGGRKGPVGHALCGVRHDLGGRGVGEGEGMRGRICG